MKKLKTKINNKPIHLNSKNIGNGYIRTLTIGNLSVNYNIVSQMCEQANGNYYFTICNEKASVNDWKIVNEEIKSLINV